MILKGFPRQFDPFFIYVTNSNKELTFSEFKTEPNCFEETLKHWEHSSSHDVMKLTTSFFKAMKNKSRDGQDKTSHVFHQTKICPNNYNKRRKLWCNYNKRTTHKSESCRYKQRKTMKKVADVEESSFAFKMDDCYLRKTTIQRGLMVDAEATSQIIRDAKKIKIHSSHRTTT